MGQQRFHDADPKIADLLKVCEDELGWSVTKTSRGSYKVNNGAGGQVTVSRTAGGPNRLNNVMKALESIGFTPAKEQAETEREADRQGRLAKDRVKVTQLAAAPPATFMPPPSSPSDAVPQSGTGRVLVVADGEMWTETINVTPEMAEEMLTRPPAVLPGGQRVEQRPLDMGHVAKLKAAIERGEWTLTPQGLIEAPDGGILDGQHRLNAILQSGKTLRMRITRNVPPQTFYALDGGKKRTVANHLSTMGEKNTNHLQSALKSLHCWEQWSADPDGPLAGWTNWSRKDVSYPQTQDVLARWPQMREAVRDGSNMMRQVKGIPAAAAVFLVLVDATIKQTYGDGPDATFWQLKLREFVQAVQTGEMIARNHPAYTLREWIRNGSGGAGPEKREKQLLALLKAWKAYVSGKTTAIVKFAPGESMMTPYLPRPVRAAT
ncbi:hypothetical protein [Micromonospora sp. NPDC005652]|uniref:hypothetical protein n=1 Tax=Micromonospora sp. NPDC005652 TaxID=3157046 RepID=UPI0033DF9FB8